MNAKSPLHLLLAVTLECATAQVIDPAKCETVVVAECENNQGLLREVMTVTGRDQVRAMVKEILESENSTGPRFRLEPGPTVLLMGPDRRVAAAFMIRLDGALERKSFEMRGGRVVLTEPIKHEGKTHLALKPNGILVGILDLWIRMCRGIP